MRVLVLGATFALATAPLYAGPHRASRSMRDQIESLETQWKKAILANDTESMDRLLSEDYLGITSSHP
jgi:hypothetical protein